VLTKRIIACMDVRDGQVVKGVQFQQLRHAGDPASLARRYNVEGIDEVVILDITATLESRRALAHTINAVAHEIFLPLTVGGGIRSEDDAAAAVVVMSEARARTLQLTPLVRIAGQASEFRTRLGADNRAGGGGSASGSRHGRVSPRRCTSR